MNIEQTICEVLKQNADKHVDSKEIQAVIFEKAGAVIIDDLRGKIPEEKIQILKTLNFIRTWMIFARKKKPGEAMTRSAYNNIKLAFEQAVKILKIVVSEYDRMDKHFCEKIKKGFVAEEANRIEAAYADFLALSDEKNCHLDDEIYGAISILMDIAAMAFVGAETAKEYLAGINQVVAAVKEYGTECNKTRLN